MDNHRQQNNLNTISHSFLGVTTATESAPYDTSKKPLLTCVSKNYYLVADRKGDFYAWYECTDVGLVID